MFLRVPNHRARFALLGIVAWASVACATDAPPADANPVSAAERESAIAAIGLPIAPEGGVINDCGEATMPEVYPAELGGAVGRALLVAVGGGPTTLTCYGMTGMQIFLLARQGDGWTTIFESQGHLVVMESEHRGVRDIAVGGPGFEFPVFEWSGEKYVFSRTIKDGKLPASIN